jgi:hypothetical protein
MATQAAARTKIAEGRSRYQALTNISVPQRQDGSEVLTGQNDLVRTGEIVELTEKEAANLMAVGAAAGRMHPAIRPASEADQPLPRLMARQLTGPVRRPAEPPPGSDLPRPDPEGSTQLIIPEALPPQLGSEQNPDQAMPWAQDAMDILPRGAR